jgi:FlaA1/EpsC-like NDP-sugar epimerase
MKVMNKKNLVFLIILSSFIITVVILVPYTTLTITDFIFTTFLFLALAIFLFISLNNNHSFLLLKKPSILYFLYLFTICAFSLLAIMTLNISFFIKLIATLFILHLSLYSFLSSVVNGYSKQNLAITGKPRKKRALIIGAGSAGAIVSKELLNSPSSTLYPVAFIDDDKGKANKTINRIPVLGTTDSLLENIEKYNIDTVIIAIPSAARSDISKMVKICNERGVKIKILPKLVDVIEGNISPQMLKDIKVEDLLGREPVELDLESISGYMNGKVILVTGAGGSIGSELCRQVLQFSPSKLLLLGHGENSIFTIENELKRKYPDLSIESFIIDINDKRSVMKLFREYHPDVIFHAAAHKHVSLMEKQPGAAIINNVFGTKVLAECAHEFKSERFILISTDKAVNPTSVMGATKKLAENIIQYYNQFSETKFGAVRFGNVLGSRGSVVLIFKEQIAKGGPVTITHPDMVRYFMTIPEGTQLVIQAGSFTQGGEIFLLDMGEPMKILDLASHLIRLSGYVPNKDIKIEFTGIRPGEKLFEEMLLAEEGNNSTKHELIYIAKPTAFEAEELLITLGKLHQLVHSYEDIPSYKYKEVISEFVKNYKPYLYSLESAKEEKFKNDN